MSDLQPTHEQLWLKEDLMIIEKDHHLLAEIPDQVHHINLINRSLNEI